MILLRSIIFKIAFPVWLALCCFYYARYLVFKVPSRTAAKSGYGWSRGVLALLKGVCHIDYEIRGQENLPKEGGYILASKHQSVWDTLIFLYILKHPAYVLKKELLKVPMFGRYLKAIDMIPVDRAAGSSAVKDMQKQVRDRLEQHRPVIIFPEGTRTEPNAATSYQPGIAFLYLDDKTDVPVIPVALNSGHFWNKSLKKKQGTIVIEYLPAIEKGLNRKSFLKQLQERIDTAYAALAKEADAKQ